MLCILSLRHKECWWNGWICEDQVWTWVFSCVELRLLFIFLWSVSLSLLSSHNILHSRCWGFFHLRFWIVWGLGPILKGHEPTYWLTSWIWRVCDCNFWKISIQVVWYNLCVEDGNDIVWYNLTLKPEDIVNTQCVEAIHSIVRWRYKNRIVWPNSYTCCAFIWPYCLT